MGKMSEGRKKELEGTEEEIGGQWVKEVGRLHRDDHSILHDAKGQGFIGS